MANIPKLKDLKDEFIFNLEAEFNIKIPGFGKSFLRGMANVLAGVIWLSYLRQGKIQKNLWVDTAEPESSGGTLERFGRVKLGRNPFPAVAGVYDVDVTGAIGATINGGTTFKSNDGSTSSGFLYVLDNDFVFTATTETIQLRALVAGIDSVLEVSDELTATIPIANVDGDAVVSAIDTEPVAAETIEEYRAKTEEAFRLEPQGSSAVDLRLWSLDVQSVRTSYPFAKSGQSAEANLYVETTVGNGTADAAVISAVEAVIELDPDTTLPIYKRGRRSMGLFDVDVQSVTPLDIVIDIASFVDKTTEKETLISDAIAAYLLDVRPFVPAIDAVDERNDTLSTNNLVQIIFETIPGSVFGAVTMTVSGTPQSSFQFIDGNIPSLDSITYS